MHTCIVYRKRRVNANRPLRAVLGIVEQEIPERIPMIALNVTFAVVSSCDAWIGGMMNTYMYFMLLLKLGWMDSGWNLNKYLESATYQYFHSQNLAAACLHDESPTQAGKDGPGIFLNHRLGLRSQPLRP